MFTEKDGTAIVNENRKRVLNKKNAKVYSTL